MPTTLDRGKIRKYLENFNLGSLFIEELGWDHGGSDTEVTIGNLLFSLKAIAHKRGLVAYQYVADSEAAFPDHPTRQKIEKAVAKTVRGTPHRLYISRQERSILAVGEARAGPA